MSKACDVCGRGYLKGLNRSHSNVATIKRQQVNVQRATIDGKHLKVCTRCIRTTAKKIVAATATAAAE